MNDICRELRAAPTSSHLKRIAFGIMYSALTLIAAPARAADPADGGVVSTAKNSCGKADWACVAECIDVRCIDMCLAKGCSDHLKDLRQCTQGAHCSGEDTQCAAEQCGKICAGAFDHSREPPSKEIADPCAAITGGAPPPKELIGGWNLQAATLDPQERKNEETNAEPRPDYEKTLQIRDNGCFILETKMEDATLGQGNLLVVRSWGTIAMRADPKKKKERLLRFVTSGGQAVGHLCAKPRVIGLGGTKFLQPEYSLTMVKDLLTLTARDANAQAFQFKKGEPLKLREEK